MSGGTDAPGSSLRVALLRGIPEYLSASVSHLADELEAGFAARGDIELVPISMHELGLVRALSAGREPPPRLAAGVENVLDSFVRYPLAIRRATTGRRIAVHHVIDQWYGHLAAWLPRERTLVSCQDLILAKYPELPGTHRATRRDRLRFAASVALLDRVAHVVCSTEATKRDLVRLRGVSPQRISVIPKGVGTIMRPLGGDRAARRASVAEPAQRIVLHVSTGWPYKNVEATLRVLAALRRDRGAAVVLVRVGVPLSESERELVRRLGVGEAVRDLGWVSDARLVELYDAADVLLFPSLDEGFGRPPVEAMACGTPVVISTAPALLEVVGDAGLSAGPNDVAGLASAVEAVLEQPTLARDLRERGLRRARRYTWEAAVSAYAEVYRLVARGGG